jgi:hypothetical protein
MTVYLSLLVAIVGLVLFWVSANPKLMEVGKISFAAGLLAFLLCYCRIVVGLAH